MIRKKREEFFLSFFSWYPKPGSNRHSPFGPRDFKSLVSTYSTIRAPFAHNEPTKVQFKTEISKPPRL